MQERGKKFIRDAIYEYVFFTELESHVVEHPAFQRLRFVLQNSSAYLTYPSNQLTRFSHSLGVAHIGGKMFISSLENASEKDLVLFINDSLSLIKEEITKLGLDYTLVLEEWKTNSVKNISGFTRNINSSDISNEEIFFTIDILWQSLRLTCLTHDIGHFPFSHIFETGLERFDDQAKSSEGDKSPNLLLASFIKRCTDYIGVPINKPKPNQEHEFFGAYIIKKITEDKRSSDKLLSLCLQIALNIFMIEKAAKPIDKNGVYACLSSIVASDIDADRIDYTLRDARSSGLNVGNFDFSRLLNHTVLAYIKEKGGDNYFKILVTEKALSSIEQFFNYRYLLYEYIYYHHNVAKFDGLIVEIIRKTLQKAIVDKDKNVLQIVCRYEFIVKARKGYYLFNLDNIEIYDDSWLRAMLLELWRTEKNDTSFKIILETFLFRKKGNVFSLVKRPSEYDNLIKDLYETIKKDSELFAKLSEYIIKGKRYEEKSGIIREIRKLLATNAVNKSIEAIIKNRKNPNYTIVYKQIKPKLASSDVTLFITNNDNYKVGQCTDVSPYLDSLKQINQTSMNFYFGCVHLSTSSQISHENFKSEVIKILIEAIKSNI